MTNFNIKIDKNTAISWFLEIFIFSILSSLISYTIFKSTLLVSFDYFLEILLSNVLIWTVFILLNIDKRIFLVLSFIVVIGLIIILFNNYDEFMLYINNFFNWIFASEADDGLLKVKPYGKFLNYSVQIVISMICILLYYLSIFPKFIIAFSGAIFLIVLSLSIFFSDINYLEIYLIFIFIITLLFSLSIFKRNSRKNKTTIGILPFFSKRIVSYTLIIVVFIALFNLIPLNFRSSELVKKVNNFTEDVLGIPNFGDNFSNEISNELGGDNTESNKIHFLLKNEVDDILYPQNDNLYLKCEVYDTYTGKSFEKSPELKNSFIDGVFDERIFLTANPAVFSNEILSIKMVDYNSNVLPVPNFMQNLGSKNPDSFDASDTFKVSSQGEVFYDKYFTDEEILIGYRNYTSPIFYDTETPLDKADYYSLPSTITQRTIDLAKSFTADNSLSTEEIVNRICIYLYNNYKYTLTPNEVKGKDFVDSFLFEHKEGYCTSFASSLFVMLRAIDIPCLYVVGYTPPNNDSADLYGYVEVSEKNLHSWVEVYIEGKNFVIFDPLAYTNSSNHENSQVEPTPTPMPTLEPSPSNEPEPSISPEPSDIPDKNEENDINGDKPTSSNSDIIIVVISIITVVGILALIYLLIKKRNDYINKILSSKDTKTAYTTLVKLLSISNFKVKNGETIREFIKRVYNSDELSKNDDTNDINLAKLIRIIEEHLYSEKQSQIDNNELLLFLQKVNIYTKNNCNPIEYFIRF